MPKGTTLERGMPATVIPAQAGIQRKTKNHSPSQKSQKSQFKRHHSSLSKPPVLKSVQR